MSRWGWKSAAAVAVYLILVSFGVALAGGGVGKVDVTIRLERPDVSAPVGLTFAFYPIVRTEQNELDFRDAAVQEVHYDPASTSDAELEFTIGLKVDTSFQLVVTAYDWKGSPFDTSKAYYYSFNSGEFERVVSITPGKSSNVIPLKLGRRTHDPDRTNLVEVFPSPTDPSSWNVSLWVGKDQVGDFLKQRNAFGG